MCKKYILIRGGGLSPKEGGSPVLLKFPGGREGTGEKRPDTYYYYYHY